MRTLLFDSDGTLVDSEGLCNQALAQLLAEQGVQVEVAMLVREYRGGKLLDIFQQLTKRYQVQFAPDTEQRYRRLVAGLFVNELKPIAGVRDVLAWAQGQDMQLAVVSNGPQAKIRQALQLCGLADYFGERIFSAYDINCFKPDGGLYRHAAHSLGAPLADCRVIEDSLPGVLAGLHAGIPTYFYNRHQETNPSVLVQEFTEMADLPQLLRQ